MTASEKEKLKACLEALDNIDKLVSEIAIGISIKTYDGFCSKLELDNAVAHVKSAKKSIEESQEEQDPLNY